MTQVSVSIDRSFQLAAAVEAAFAFLADIPAWGRLFPRVASIDGLPDHGPDAWRWTMEPLGPPGFEAQTVYGCRYVLDPAAHTVGWTPIEDIGNARFAGEVRLAPDGGNTLGTLWLTADLEVPAPRFARSVVQPAVAFEMGRMTDRFLEHVSAALKREL